jgi:type IV pilus assembly protein PilA
MLHQNLRAKIGARLNGDKEAGFTLIELLVVMLILGILAAIALPAFFNQRDKAGDSEAKATAHSAQVAIETYATENDGQYTGATVTALENIESTLPPITNLPSTNGELTMTVTPTASPSGYNITVRSTTGNTFSIVNSGGTMTYPCTNPGDGGCPDAGVDGEGNPIPAEWD